MATKSRKKLPFTTKLGAAQIADLNEAARLEAERLGEGVPESALFRTAAFTGPSIYEILRRNGKTPKSGPTPLAAAV